MSFYGKTIQERGHEPHGVNPVPSRIWSITRWFFLLLPGILTTWLVHTHAVNSMLWDDFLFGAEWVRWENGDLDWRELFGVHMEHRQVIARSLSLLMHQIFDEDIRAQNGLSLVFLWATAGMMLWLLRRGAGPLRGGNWWLAFAMMAAMFSPIQWQTLLWAITFALFVSMACFTASVLPWFTRLGDRTAFGISFFFALLATISFANGLLVWALVPVAILLARPLVPWKSRLRMLALWLAGGGIVAALYFSDFGNTVNEAYAYGQGGENTLSHSATHAIHYPGRLLAFVATLQGGNLSRGLPFETITAAACIGGLLLFLFMAAAAAHFVPARSDAFAELPKVLPWFLLGAFGIGTAALIGFGRMWIGDSLAQAVSGRYTTHAILLTASLPVIAALGFRRQSWIPRAAGTGALAILLALQFIQWTYGIRMMDHWRNSRFADLAMLRFSALFPDKRAFSITSGDGPFGCQVAEDIHAMGRLSPRLLADLKLKSLGSMRPELPESKAAFTMWETDGTGETNIAGYAALGSDRPADLIVFTQKVENEEQIIAIHTPVFPRTSLGPRPIKDYEFTRISKVDDATYFGWKGQPVFLQAEDPGKPIRAYVFDAEKRRIFPIKDLRPESKPRVRLRNQ